MGLAEHNAVLVTSQDETAINEAYTILVEILKDKLGDDFNDMQLDAFVTPVSPPAVNGQRSFVVLPHGSQQRYETSSAWAGVREVFKEQHLRYAPQIMAVEVKFGKEDYFLPTPPAEVTFESPRRRQASFAEIVEANEKTLGLVDAFRGRNPEDHQVGEERH